MNSGILFHLTRWHKGRAVRIHRYLLPEMIELTDFVSPESGFSQDPAKTWSAPTKDMRQRLADHLEVPVSEIPKGVQFIP